LGCFGKPAESIFLF